MIVTGEAQSIYIYIEREREREREGEREKKTFCNRYIYIYIYIYIYFKTFFYVVRHLDSTASYLPTGLHLGFFCSWPSLYLPRIFSSVFLVLSLVSASTSSPKYLQKNQPQCKSHGVDWPRTSDSPVSGWPLTPSVVSLFSLTIIPFK